MAQMRLDKFFSSQNLASRKEFKALLKAGVVSVNGQPALRPEQKIDPTQDEIRLNGQVIGYQKYLYLMLNKPQGYVSATDDPRQPTVLELVPEQWRRPGLFPAGRLDKDTTGLMLITDDGELAHRILAPKSHVEKAYHARIDGPISQQDILRFEKGAVLEDGYQCLPAQMKVLEEGEHPLVEIILMEGKYHQIKRMVASLGRKVLTLKRVRMGGLVLDESLPEGQCREILHKDIEKFLCPDFINSSLKN